MIVTYVIVVGPWQRRWGASEEEVRRSMPGDDLLRPSAPSTTRAITIDAPPEAVFPWLLQIGYGRGGWYSYDWIDNDGKPSMDRIDSALQRLAVGDRIEMLPGMGPVVREIVPNHHIVSGGESDSGACWSNHGPRWDTVDQSVEAGLAEGPPAPTSGSLYQILALLDGAEDAPADPGTRRADGAVSHVPGRTGGRAGSFAEPGAGP